MRAHQFIVEGKQENANIVEMFKDFLPLAMEVLELDSLPTMKFEGSLELDPQPSFGMYVAGENILFIALKNRHPVDILRTIAHELVHYKQDLAGELHDESGVTGSEHENQANSIAGIIMRQFNKKYPQYLSTKPI
jgi:Zn-dependent peptidase ImmA (M78 family)